MGSQRKILIVDDEFLVALAMAQDLEENGFAVAGPYANAEDAETHIEDERPDAAFLDVNLGNGRTSYRLARRLKDMGVPFLFVTGYSSLDSEHTDLNDTKRLSKPVAPAKAVAEAEKLCSLG
ncbi:response regulator [Aurantiacibacter poecillastricola]|uniref:response regulator n=1 Tax=Aurantiacibacter poecillastricola TaxID=3064385 RepID=UPI00274005F7|nr:response regulator [Aurantiacibacter sp. 219JJ12-13]MDP5261369.1 response regulator [Aurantiacibacter sp. 219JJ12-13]